MAYVFSPAPQVAIPVAGSFDLYPVRRIYCVGRNYAAHAREMGADPEREAPFFFAKPADAILPVRSGVTADLPYPVATADCHHEIELVAALGTGGRDIPVETAAKAVWGYAVGLDMTRRDLQLALREKGRPWELGKAFDASAPIGPITPAGRVPNIGAAAIWIKVNGTDRQRSETSQMIWNVAETIAELSRYVALAPGDLIFTGTPEGVGPVRPGDRLEAGIEGLGELSLRVV